MSSLVPLSFRRGGEITVAAPKAPQHGQIIDLMQALKQSIEKAKPKQKAAPAQRNEKRVPQIRNTPVLFL